MPIRQAFRALPFLLFSLPFLPPAAAQEGGAWQGERHGQCLAQAVAEPEAALDAALDWQAAEPAAASAARHCAAVALIGLGAYAQAAAELEALASLAPDPTPEGRAALLAEAGNAWVLADDLTRAIALLDEAIALLPEAASLHVDRGLALALAGDFWGAVDDFNRAEDLDPERVDVLIYRATAYRYLEAWELAAADLERALSLSPGNPNALLERGQLRRAQGDLDAARQDFLAVLRFDAEGPLADAARLAIEEMDLKVED